MKNIDFLPEIYRQQGELRRARVWWCAVVVIFGTAIGLAAGAQFWLRHNITRQLAELQPQFAQAQIQSRELSNLNAQITTAGRAAGLFTFLDDPWPRTQLLAELLRPLPQSVQLTRIQIGEEEVLRAAQATGSARHRRGRQEEVEGPKLSPVEQDLAQLRADAERRQTFIDLDGQTQDVTELHAYVAEIGRSGLFAFAQIRSLEATPGDKLPIQTTFTVRAIVRPGHAVLGGNSAAPAQPAATTSTGTSSPTQRLAARRQRAMKTQTPLKTPSKPRTWLITALLAAVSVAYVVFIFLPVQRSIRQLSAELQQQRQELVQAQSLARPIAQARQRLAETREVCLHWQQGAPTPSNLAIHFASLTQHAEDAAVVMERFDPQLAAQMQILAQHNITLQFHGEFRQVFEFLARLERLPAAIWFRNLQVSQAQPGDATLQAELTLTIFVDHSDYSD